MMDNKRLASWIAIWQFLRGLDRYALNCYPDIDGRADASEIAPNEEMIRQHAQEGGFPANRISEIKAVIDPTTAEV